MLEFQAMVTGIACSDGICVSESLAIQEFLSSDLVDEARFEYLEKFKGNTLIPFGHSKECKSNNENIGFMKSCQNVLPPLRDVAISVVPETSLETINQMPSLNTTSSKLDDLEIATIKRETEELQRSEYNLQKIGPQIMEANYHIQDVQGDGNCCFYAILQCLNPDKNYEHVTQEDENWQEAKNLRDIFSQDPNLSQMVTNLLDPQQKNRFLPLEPEVLSRIAQRLNLPIIIINSTYVEDAAFEDPTNHGFIIVNPKESTITPTDTFKDALETTGENPIVLLYTPNHWKAVIPHQSTKSSDKSSD